jgi:hypothetical protein
MAALLQPPSKETGESQSATFSRTGTPFMAGLFVIRVSRRSCGD